MGPGCERSIASGLPVIVSNRCGCAPELVNGNGFTFDPTNGNELAARLLEMASLSDQERSSLARGVTELQLTLRRNVLAMVCSVQSV